ncbi:histone deacetylase complex subunit SAP130-A-like [Littorina saxatilis]|uniref:histone deacetylase complex subunit SAP130-A-like n=1 Tax=Littorina saxatilis TaxID=31220 RepID=UPI0038B5A322
MSQHPSYPPHLPRGAVAASALTLPKNAGTTVLRAGTSPAIQIPAAPSVPSVSVSVAGLPGALGRNPVISAIRPGTPPTSHSLPEHPRTNLIVQGPAASVSGQPLQITLTQRVAPGGPVGMAPLGGKTVQVAQTGLLQQKVTGGQLGHNSLAGMGMAPHLLAASKPGGLQVNTAVPAISINSLSAPMPTATVVAPSTSIPIAKVTPQRQQISMSGLPTSIAVQAMSSGSEFTTVSDLSTMATQASAGQLLLSQTQRTQPGTLIAPTTGVSITTAMPTAVASLAPHQGERTIQPGAMFNLTAAAAPPGTATQGQQDVWQLSQLFYQQAVARGQLMSAPTANTTQLVRPATNTFFVPRPGGDQTKITTQTPNLAASLSHQLNPNQSMLLNAQMMVDGLRPLGAAMTTLSGAVVSSSGISVHSDHKPAISLSTSSSQSGIHASLIAASTAAASSHASDFSSSTSLHMAASLAGSSAASVLTPNMGLSAITNLASRATVASSIYASATAHQAQNTHQPQAPGTPGGTSNMNANSSPRPSILRKRTLDGNTVMPRKPNFSLMAESHSPRPDTAPLSNISSPKTPATENSQSSTDTALSSNDATTPTHNSHGDVKVKVEPMDGAENGPAAASPAVSLGGSMTDASPRKRARKQLFDVSHRNDNDEVKDNTSSDEDLDSRPAAIKDFVKQEHPLEHRDEYIDENGIRWTRERTKPTMSIMSDYSVTWKPRLNHFPRHTDVRAKDDRNPTVNELISQRGILQKASGWKLYYVSAQVEDVIENEQSMEERMEKLKERLAAKASSHTSSEQDYNKLLELTRGNLQRCQVVRQQMMEAKTNMLNILKHEPKIKEIIHKNLAKRTIKKKERS